MPKKTAILLVVLSFIASACGEEFSQGEMDAYRSKSEPGKADSSAQAVFLEFAFSGKLLTSSTWNKPKQIEKQLLFTIGQLNGERSVGRLDHLDLSNVKNLGKDADTGLYQIRYDAKMIVAWGKKSSVPSTYTLQLPRDISSKGQRNFTKKYKDTCVDWSAHEVDTGSMWYYYRPNAYRCKLDAADVYPTEAVVTPSAVQTTGKFPEYHKVWEDGVLKVVAVFGKYEDGATSPSDAGIRAYNSFVGKVRRMLNGKSLQTVPADAPSSPGVDTPDIEFSAKLAHGKTITIVALLVDNVRTAGYTFNKRYAQLSRDADLIAYNGHSGLGANIRALAQRGQWQTGQYVMVFMNGCDTYAYVDSALADAHARVNADDPVGTKYVDIVMNAMPAYFRSDAPATMALIRGLMAFDAPKTFEQMFADVDRAQIVLVSGEQDNVYYPGYGEGGGGTPQPWAGLSESGTVKRGEELRYETPTLESGRYIFRLEGNHDADLYVRLGKAPTRRLYDCRPYRYGSKETCAVTITEPAPIHVMVRGWASTSDFKLVGEKQ